MRAFMEKAPVTCFILPYPIFYTFLLPTAIGPVGQYPRTGGSPAATPSRSTSVCFACAGAHAKHTLVLLGNALLLNKIDTASNANSFKRTWIVVGHLSLHISKEGLPTTICKADGVPQFPSIPGIVNICSSNDLEVVTIRCAIN